MMGYDERAAYTSGVRIYLTRIGFYDGLGYHEEPRLVLARWLDGRPSPPG